MLEKVDLFLLDSVFQKIADWVNDRTGKSCFWLAKIVLWSLVVLQTAELFVDEISPLGTMLYLGLGVILLWNIRLAEERDARRQQAMNPMRIQVAWLRQMFLIMVLLISTPMNIKDLLANHSTWLLEAINIGEDFLFTSALYFLSCTPKPPKLLKVGNELATASIPVR